MGGIYGIENLISFKRRRTEGVHANKIKSKGGGT
jgi:hypothetical protein